MLTFALHFITYARIHTSIPYSLLVTITMTYLLSELYLHWPFFLFWFFSWSPGLGFFHDSRRAAVSLNSVTGLWPYPVCPHLLLRAASRHGCLMRSRSDPTVTYEHCLGTSHSLFRGLCLGRYLMGYPPTVKLGGSALTDLVAHWGPP